MKFCKIIIVIICAIALIECTAHKKIEYNVPKSLPPEIRAIFLERCEKGRILFKLNCSGCHGIFTRGRDGVPNFTKDQIKSYSAVALIGRDSTNHAVAKKMSPQQIDYIVQFLSLRKAKK